MINFKNRKLLLSTILIAFIIILILPSCSKPSSEESIIINKEVSFDYNLEFNDIDIMNSDSLYYELTFDMIGMEFIDMSIEIDDILYNSFKIVDIDSSSQVLGGYIPFNENNMNIKVSFIDKGIVIANQYHVIPLRRNIEVLTFSNNINSKYFDSLFDKNKFVNNNNIIYDKFKKYDFTNTEVIILNDLDMLSEKMIVELQKFLLNEGYIFVVMNKNIKDNNELSYSLGYPQVKAIRGSSRNQFFSVTNQEFLNEYSFLSKNLVNQSQLYRYFELKDNEEEFSKIMISTNDPLLLEKEVLGGKIFFLTTKIDPNWSNKSFNLVLNDILNRVFFQRLLTDES